MIILGIKRSKWCFYSHLLNLYTITTEISKVHLRDELWFRSGDWYTLFVEKGLQKQSEVGM